MATDYTLPNDINYQKQLYTNLGIGDASHLDSSLSQNRLGTDIMNHLDNNPSIKNMLGSGISGMTGAPKVPVNIPQTGGVNLPVNGSTIDTSISAINNMQNPEAKYASLGDEINTRLGGNNAIRDKMLEGINKLNGIAINTQTPTSYMDTYEGLANKYNLTADATKISELNRAITGTEGDIRGEIAKAGGVGNASQVASLTAERAKPLINEYNVLKDALATKVTLVENLMNYSKLDRESAEREIDRKTNLNEKIIDSYGNLQQADSATLNSLMSYDNNQKTLSQNKLRLLLENGGLSTLPDASLAKLAVDTGLDIGTLRSASTNVDIANKLKNELSRAQITAQYASANRDNASAEKDRAGIIQATTQQNKAGLEIINNISNILSNTSLNKTSGAQGAIAILDPNARALNGQIDQVKNQLTVENRGKLKGQGTITDSETNMLEKSASILNTPFLPYEQKVAELQKIKGTISLMNNIPTVVTVTDKTGKTASLELKDSAQLEFITRNGGKYDFNVKN